MEARANPPEKLVFTIIWLVFGPAKKYQVGSEVIDVARRAVDAAEEGVDEHDPAEAQQKLESALAIAERLRSPSTRRYACAA